MISQEWNTTLMTLIFSFPAVASVVCAMVVAVYGRSACHIPRRLISTLVTASLVSAFAWGCMVCYLQWHRLFVVLQVPFYYAFTVFHALLYRIICGITGTGKKEYFSKMHYIVPAIVPAVLWVWSFFVPLDVQIHIVESRGHAMPGYEAYTMLFISKPVGFLAWSILYNLLSFKRVIDYRRTIGDYSADEGRSPVRWLRMLILYAFSVIMLPLIAVAMGRAVFAGSLWMLFPSLLTAAEVIVLSYHVVSENYIVTTDTDEKANVAVQGKAHRINRKYFEHYIQTQKPYLNPKIRITDIAADLHSNRTYLSNFINSEYGMNFSRYINLQRLKELDVLRHDPETKEVLGIELVSRTGFSTYRGYTRAKAEEDKNNLLKEFE